MSEPTPNVVVLGGSLREGSRTNLVHDAVVHLLRKLGGNVQPLRVDDLDLPLFPGECDPDAVTDDVKRLLEAVRTADALVLATPVYHGVVSGAVKNAIDYLEYLADDDPPYLGGRPVALVAVSGGIPGVNAINSLVYSCQALHALVVPTTVAASGAAFDAEGRMVRALTQRLARQAKEILEFARGRASQPAGAAGDG